MQRFSEKSFFCNGFKTIGHCLSVNDAGWGKSKKYRKLSDYEKKLLMGFVNNSVLTGFSGKL